MNNNELYEKMNRLALYLACLIAALVCGAVSPVFLELGEPMIGTLFWVGSIFLLSLGFGIQFNGYNRQLWAVIGVSLETDVRGDSA
jgi:hypothetical protein